MNKQKDIRSEFKVFAKQVALLALVPSAITVSVLAAGNELLRAGCSAPAFIGTMVAGSLAIGASVPLILRRLDR